MGSASSSIRRSRRRRQDQPPPQPYGQHGQPPHYPNHPPPPFPQPYGAHPNAAPQHPAYYPAAPGPAHPPPPPPPQQQQPPQTPPGTSHVHEATTVRNLVNLKKATLKLSPRAGSPHILDIAFTLDVVTECRVSIFLLGKEDNRTGEIKARSTLCGGVTCPAGMNIKFPFEGLPAEQSSIDTSRYSPDELNAANVGAWQYPLIIRLETLADKQPADAAHALDARVPGSALVAWVQSQTTYVVLGETAPDADDDSKVVRQRIWVQSQFYLLQEIYGITEANQAATSDDDFSAHCVVCLTNRKNTTVLPCRHFCMCDECAKLLLKRTRTCPMCRLPISSVLNIQMKSASPTPS